MDDVGVYKKKARTPGLLSALGSSTEAEMDRYACSENLGYREACYKIGSLI